MKIRLVGDVHGKFHAYKERILQEDVDASIQLGDFGFAQEWYKLIRHKIDPERHKIIPGNHEDYHGIRADYTFGTDWGTRNFHGLDFWFIRGAYSVDVEWRTIGISWWPQEEIEYKFLEMAIEQFSDEKPEIVLAHECPGDHTGISTLMFQKNFIPNRTASALNQMWNNHKPKLWIFGHWHENKVYDAMGTTFICLDELDYVDYEIEEHIGNDISWNIVKLKEQMRKLYNKRHPLRW